MSDHRFGLKIEFSIYGMNFEWEPDLNWHAHDGGCDPRIIDWFDACYNEARAAWDHQNAIEDQAKEARRIEQSERAELTRLKAKYEWPNPLIPQPDAAASTEDSIELDWGRIDSSSGVRWRDPTPAGIFTTKGITCRICGCVVVLKLGEMISRGDPRLCVHLGGPKRHDPECYLRTEDGTPCNCPDEPCTCAPGTARSSCPVHGLCTCENATQYCQIHGFQGPTQQ